MAHRKRTKQVSEKRKQCIIAAVRAGLSHSHMVRSNSMPRSTVADIMRRHRINGITQLSERRGSKPKRSTKGLRLLLKYARAHRFDPLYVIATKYEQHTGIQLSINTVRRYLHQNGIDSYVAVHSATSFLLQSNLHLYVRECGKRKEAVTELLKLYPRSSLDTYVFQYGLHFQFTDAPN